MTLFFFQAEDGIRDYKVTGVQTCALPILRCRHRSLTMKQLALATFGLKKHAIQQGDKKVLVSKSFENYGGLTPSTSRISIPSFAVLRCPAAAQRCIKVLKIQQRVYPREIFRSVQNSNFPQNHLICCQISCSFHI